MCRPFALPRWIARTISPLHWQKAIVLTTFPINHGHSAARRPGAGRVFVRKVPMPHRKSSSAREHAITIRGAREHNLKNIDVTIPRDQLVVFTGLSGSGKSSLAFDTIYAEGQR